MIELNDISGLAKKKQINILINIILFLFTSLPFIFLLYKSVWADNIKNNIVIYLLLSIEAYFFSRFITNKPVKLLASCNLLVSNISLFLFLTMPTILSIILSLDKENLLIINIKTLVSVFTLHMVSFIFTIVYKKMCFKK